MFFGDIAAANERKTRKQVSAANNSSSGDDSRLRRMKPPANERDHILYSEAADTIPREVLLDFLTTCSEMMLDETNMREIINESVEEKVGLDQAAVEFQRDVLEYNFRIERNFGCRYLSSLGVR